MLSKASMESLKELKLQGVSQFAREYEQTRDLETDRKVCNMNKLFLNEQTGEKIDPLTTKLEETFIEHCSPRILF